MSVDAIKNVNPFIASVPKIGGERVATTQARKENNERLAFTGRSEYTNSSITSPTGYGLAFGVQSTGIQGAGASSCGGSLNIVA